MSIIICMKNILPLMLGLVLSTNVYSFMSGVSPEKDGGPKLELVSGVFTRVRQIPKSLLAMELLKIIRIMTLLLLARGHRYMTKYKYILWSTLILVWLK